MGMEQWRLLLGARLPSPSDWQSRRIATGARQLTSGYDLGTLKRFGQYTERRLALPVMHLMVM